MAYMLISGMSMIMDCAVEMANVLVEYASVEVDLKEIFVNTISQKMTNSIFFYLYIIMQQ